ncbi:dihydrofolate reductase family protein [Oerskovia flava]|uniref:dihydrofolate reductase family protein n=1 Tax=Oerskovia flava TaxID=2986422 RepID=UPI00223EDE2E|nr:dihydrofolate reductase family protein [Oerskovia sp. JB1-3-2]
MTCPTAPPASPSPSAGTRPLPALDVLVPTDGTDGTRIDPDPSERRLSGLYAYPEGATVRANMVTSVDGAAWGPDGRSGSINDAADWRVFRVLRALADVVLVGAGTARAEGYGPLGVPRGLGGLRRGDRPLEVAVVTGRGDVPPGLVTTDRAPYVLTSARGADAARRSVPADRVVAVGQDEVDLRAGLTALAGRGLRHVLCEGGPRLLGDLLADDLVDELCLTTTPRLIGPGPGRVVGPVGGPAPATVRDAHLAHLLHSRGTLLARWVRPIG